MKPLLDPAWLIDQREQAGKKFHELPLPNRKNENFKYTYLAELKFPEKEDEAVVSFSSKDLDSEVYIRDLKIAAEENEEIVKKYLLHSNKYQQNKFLSLAYAKWQNGLFIYIPANTIVEDYIGIQSIVKKFGYNARYCIVLGENAKVKIFHECKGDENISQSITTNAVWDIWLEQGASLDFSQAQNFPESVNYFIYKNFHVAAKSKLAYTTLHLGGKKGQEHVNAYLQEEGSEFQAKGAARANKSQHMDLVVSAIHDASHTTSGMRYWFVMDEKAKGIFNGEIQVKKHALHTDAFQKCKGLLLSREATIHSMPKLIIATDEVACQHGSSISEIDPDQLFYLESRGISREEAIQFIVKGLTEEVVASFPSQEIQDKFEKILEEKLIS